MLDNLLIAMRCVAPIIICLFVGGLVRRSGLLSEETNRQMNRLVFTFLFPQHLFITVYKADFATSFSLPLLLFYLGIVTFYLIISIIVLRRQKISPREIGVMSQNAYRSNLNIVSLPLAESLLCSAGLASMGIIAGIMTPVYNFYAVFTLEMHREGGKFNLKEVLIEIIKNPLVIGAAAGYLMHLLPFRLPEVLLSTMSTMGKTGTTLALILLGASFRLGSLVSDRKRIIGGNIMRLIAAPLFAFLLALLIGLENRDIALLVLAAGAPLATVSYTMCQVYDSDAELAAELIVTTSMLCCLTLFLWIFALKQLGIA